MMLEGRDDAWMISLLFYFEIILCVGWCNLILNVLSNIINFKSDSVVGYKDKV